jgi:hypothetical protein
VATVPAGGLAGGLAFGHTARPGSCPAGAVVASIRAIDPVDGEARAFRPIQLTRPGTGAPWTGSRLAIASGSPITYIQRDEYAVTELYVGGLSAAQHPNLTLRFRYQKSYQQVVAVVAGDGTPARFLGSGSAQPATLPGPGDFAYFDLNGELYLYNLPARAGGAYEAVAVVTRVTGASGTLTATASVGGKIVNGRLTSISGTCADSAVSIIFSGATAVMPGAAPVDDVPDGPGGANPY